MSPMKKVMKLLPHVSIVMAGMMIVFFCIDRVNQPMGFMTNEFHRWLSLFLALFSLGYSILWIAYQRKQERYEEHKRLRPLQAKRGARPVQSERTTVRQNPTARPAQSARPVPARRPAQTGRTMQER